MREALIKETLLWQTRSRADRYYDEGKLKKAATLYRQTLHSTHPDLATALYRYASITARDIHKTLVEGPEDTHFLETQIHRLEEVESQLKRYDPEYQYPKTWKNYRLLGVAYAEADYISYAEKAFDTALQSGRRSQDKQDILYHYTATITEYSLDRLREKLDPASLERQIQRLETLHNAILEYGNPHNDGRIRGYYVDTANLLGFAYKKSGDIQAAERVFTKALKLCHRANDTERKARVEEYTKQYLGEGVCSVPEAHPLPINPGHPNAPSESKGDEAHAPIPLRRISAGFTLPKPSTPTAENPSLLLRKKLLKGQNRSAPTPYPEEYPSQPVVFDAFNISEDSEAEEKIATAEPSAAPSTHTHSKGNIRIFTFNPESLDFKMLNTTAISESDNEQQNAASAVPAPKLTGSSNEAFKLESPQWLKKR